MRKKSQTRTIDFEDADVRNAKISRVQSDADQVVSVRSSRFDGLNMSDIVHGRGEGKTYQRWMMIFTAVGTIAAVVGLVVSALT